MKKAIVVGGGILALPPRTSPEKALLQRLLEITFLSRNRGLAEKSEHQG
jgi:hypothetical protein